MLGFLDSPIFPLFALGNPGSSDLSSFLELQISMCTMVSSTTLLHATALSNTSTSTNYKRTSTSCLATSSCSLYNEPQLTSHMHRHLKRLSSTSCCIYTSTRYRSFERESTFLWYQSNIRSSGQLFERISLLSQRSGKKTRQQRDVVKCAASEEVQTEKPVELPIFPLPLVLFPGASPNFLHLITYYPLYIRGKSRRLIPTIVCPMLRAQLKAP